MFQPLKSLLVGLAVAVGMSAAHAEKMTIAAAADLKFALTEIVTEYKTSHPKDDIEVVFGSSGKFSSQIQQNAPYDLFFSADILYPRELVKAGDAIGPAHPYAYGRIVLWSNTLDASKMTLDSLTGTDIKRVAIANPKHAPYGKRAEEALKAAGVWDKVEPKLVYGENISHTAQLVETGNAQVGVIALSLALNPKLAAQGKYWLIPDKLHEPLEQAFVITKRGADNPVAKSFAAYMEGPQARAVMKRYGFVLPGELK